MPTLTLSMLWDGFYITSFKVAMSVELQHSIREATSR